MPGPACDGANTARQTAAWWMVNLFVLLCRLWFDLLGRVGRCLVALAPSFFERFLALKRLAGSTGPVSAGSKAKEPSVVSIVLAEAGASKFDLAKVAQLAKWCTEEGMCYLFVYDPSGNVKANSGELVSELSALAPHWEIFVQIGWQQAKGAAPSLLPLPPKTAVVHVLDEGDSLTPLVVAAKNPRATLIRSHPGIEENGIPDVFTGLSPGELKDLICELLGNAAVLEPDIVMVVGKVFTLAGSPPWHARFSEIYHLGGDLDSVFRHDFDKAMSSYWKTYQRFGT